MECCTRSAGPTAFPAAMIVKESERQSSALCPSRVGDTIRIVALLLADTGYGAWMLGWCRAFFDMAFRKVRKCWETSMIQLVLDSWNFVQI